MLTTFFLGARSAAVTVPVPALDGALLIFRSAGVITGYDRSAFMTKYKIHPRCIPLTMPRAANLSSSTILMEIDQSSYTSVLSVDR